MSGHDFSSALEKYRSELHGSILPFWMQRGVDREQGGYFTCFSNDGSELLHEHKFTWSQGRFVWMMARLARKSGPRDQRSEYLETAASGARFLMRHCRLDNGNCAFILDRAGRPVLLDEEGRARQAGPGEGYDLSIYADFFVIYGLGEYARASGDREPMEFALELYRSVLDRFASGAYRTDPYPVPEGYKVHGKPMILLETSQELAEAARELDMEREAVELEDTANECAAEIMDNFRRPAMEAVLEMIGTDNIPKDDLLGRYINPGHTIEDMWFVMHRALRTDNNTIFEQAVETMRWALEKGWDSEYGGLLLFQDRDGGPPRGDIPAALNDHVMVHKVSSDWDSKLWWPHSEALYALLLALDRLEEPWIEQWYWKVHDYVFETFPNPDRETGEWIQIRDRRGRPESKVVALPVKDPFHIVRAFVLAIPVLERLAGRQGRLADQPG